MKIQGYERKELPSGESDSVLALSGEWSRPLTIPREDRSSGIMKVAGVMQDMGDRFVQAEDVAEYNRAMVDAHKGQAEIQNELRTKKRADGSLEYGDKNLEEHETAYKERSKTLKDGIAEKIKSGRVKEKFSTSYDDLDVRGLVQTRDLGRNRLINRERAATESQLSTYANLMVQTGDLQKWADMQGLVESKVAAGFFTPEEGQQLQDKWRDKAIGAYWDRAIQDGPTLAYKMMTAEKQPDSFARLDEDTKTKLIAKAKAASESGEHQARLQTTFAKLDQQFGNNPNKKIAFLENSSNLPELRLDERNQLITTYHAQISRAREAVNQARMDGNRAATDAWSRLFTKGDFEAAARMLDDPRFTGEQRTHFAHAIELGSKADKTVDTVRTEFTQAFHKRTLPGVKDESYSDARFIELVDSRRLNGLSNADADKLVGMVKDKSARYTQGIKYANEQYAQAFPKAGEGKNPTMAARRSDFIDFVTAEWERQGKEKGRMLTPDEQNDIIHHWLDEKVVEERKFWFDRTGREWEDKVKGVGAYTTQGKVPAGRSVGQATGAGVASMTGPAGPPEIHGVPRDHADKIRAYLSQINAKRPPGQRYDLTTENIQKFYKDPANRHLWQPRSIQNE